MPKIITIGEILVEVYAKEIGQSFLETGELVGPFPSGAPAIFIDQVARMGSNCGIISKIGDDDFGKQVYNRLQADGVDVSQVLISPDHTTGTAFVTYYHDGSRHFIFHFRHSASGYLQVQDINAGYFDDCEYFHIMGCSVLASDSLRDAILKSAELAKSKGIVISFDPNIRPELIRNEKDQEAIIKILNLTDILLVGVNELESIAESNDPEKIKKFLQDRKIKTTIVKKGSKGISILNNDMEINLAPITVKEVDPTGAGDCFDGAFISMLSEGSNILEAAKVANVAGALSVTKKGPMEGAHMKNEIMTNRNLLD